jgi:hypothetical protein
VSGSDCQQVPPLFRGRQPDYERLLDLDRAGWAWEWLRRNPNFAALKSISGARLPARFPLVIRPDAASEHGLLRWGLHFG